MQACNRQSTYCVPLYDSLGEDAIEYIVDHASCSIVFVSALKFPGLVEALPRLKHTVKTIVYWGAPDQIAIQVSHTFLYFCHRQLVFTSHAAHTK